MPEVDPSAAPAVDSQPAPPQQPVAAPAVPAASPAPTDAPAVAEPPGEPQAKLLKRLAELERGHRQAAVREREAQEKLAKLQQLEERLGKDPLAVLAERGYDHAKISDALLQQLGGKPEPEPATQALTRIEQLEKQLAERDAQARAAASEATTQQQINHLRKWAADPAHDGKFSGIASLGLEAQLRERVMSRVNSEGLRGAEIDQALAQEAESIESALQTQVARQVEALAKSPRWRDLFAAAIRTTDTPATQDSALAREPPPAPPVRRPAQSSQPPSTTRGLSPTERTARAAEALRDKFRSKR